MTKEEINSLLNQITINILHLFKVNLHVKERRSMISKDLLDVLCCPESKADLVLDGDYLVSTDKNTRRRYRIEDDIPIMLIEESEQLDEDTWQEIMKRHGKQAE